MIDKITLILIILSTADSFTWTTPVTTTQGEVRGLLADDGDYSMYLGIPYAKVDKDNPFGESKPHPKFEEIFDAHDDTAICPQEEEFNNTIVGTLDCLHLNIYVPNTSEVKPVLVWIHGGAFTTGFSGRYLYGPKYLVRHDIILVTVNYRLGPYGFMCLDIEEVPGNQGLKDQYLALQWIYENIGAFGGDIDKITVMGESAGSMSIDFHLMSERPQLYNQVILQSGTGLVPAVVLPSNKEVANRIAAHLGFVTNDVKEALSYLAEIDVKTIIAVTLELGMRFRVCVEKEFNGVEAIIPVHPEHINIITKVNNMNILAGFNSHEQMYLYLPEPESIKDTFFHDYIAHEYNTENLGEMITKVRRFYIGDEEIKKELIWELIDFASDIKFNHPIQRGIEKYIDSGANVYQYMFSYSGHRNFLKVLHNISGDGATHADELGYLFDMSFMTETPTTEDQLVIDRMTTMWANFVKYGNPTSETSNLIPYTWPPASKDVMTYLGIDRTFTIGTRPLHARLSFWDLFYSANRDQLKANLENSSSPISSPIFILLYILTISLTLK